MIISVICGNIYYTDDVSCMRCETTYYCEGEGVQKMCGRCENSSASCDKNPIEHSFGVESECQPCPAGWVCLHINFVMFQILIAVQQNVIFWTTSILRLICYNGHLLSTGFEYFVCFRSCSMNITISRQVFVAISRFYCIIYIKMEHVIRNK